MRWPFTKRASKAPQEPERTPAPQEPERTPAPLRQRQYAAAKLDRLVAGWNGFTQTADAAINGSLTKIRARSRQLAVDNDYARRFFDMLKVNVVGAEGIRLQSRVVKSITTDGIEYDDAANSMIEREWKKWARKNTCSVDGKLSWIGIQKQVVAATAIDGEVLVRKIKGRDSGNPYGFALQLMEADHLDEKHNNTLANGNQIRMGIEYNKWNRPVAYHLLTRHPGDSVFSGAMVKTERERVPADEIIHLFMPDRVSQSRGLPWLYTAMRRLKMLGVYEENELVAAGVAAAKMGFYVRDDATVGQDYTGDDKDSDGNLISQAEPGIFEILPVGTKFEAWDPQHPTSAFGDFIKAMLRGVASGMGVGYNSLANDGQGINFSSLRHFALADRDHWRSVQGWLIEHLCTEVFEEWLSMGMTTGALPLPLSRFDTFNSPVWRPRGWRWVDPLKEMKAYEAAVNAGFISKQDVASELGLDVEDVFAQLAHEQKLAEKYGIASQQPAQAGIDELLLEEELKDEQNNN